MEMEGNVSKVAICPSCDGFVKACHIEGLDDESEKEFTQFTNEGFTVKLETIEETQDRKLSSYKDCLIKRCNYGL
jgi:hypothetical protein